MPRTFIVKSKVSLFLMKEDDFRFPPAEFGYQVIEQAQPTGAKHSIPLAGRTFKAREFKGSSGKLYNIFHDWSAKEQGK